MGQEQFGTFAKEQVFQTHRLGALGIELVKVNYVFDVNFKRTLRANNTQARASFEMAPENEPKKLVQEIAFAVKNSIRPRA